ncbi:MAG: hypothetical protein P1S60_17865 [Anaerolineae bacterium]|nr:hypothetical protein [Anaerolineae bacterium]
MESVILGMRDPSKPADRFDRDDRLIEGDVLERRHTFNRSVILSDQRTGLIGMTHPPKVLVNDFITHYPIFRYNYRSTYLLHKEPFS